MRGHEFFTKLPQKLSLNIVDGLSLEDILRLQLVCQSWHHIFSSDEICARALKKNFALPLEYYYKKPSSNCTEFEEKKFKSDWIRRFMINRIRREHGIASQAFIIDNCDIDSSYVYYCNGRMAFTDPGTLEYEDIYVEIEDLVTRERWGFEAPPKKLTKRGTQLYDQFFTIPLTTKKVLAWHLITKKKYSIQLSADVYSVTAFRNKIGIVTITPSLRHRVFTYEALTWDVESGLRKLMEFELDVSGKEDGLQAANIFFHSTEKDVIFLVYNLRMKSASGPLKVDIKVTVQCFEGGIPISLQDEIIYNLPNSTGSRSFLISNDNVIGFDLWEFPDSSKNKNYYKYVSYNMNQRLFDSVEVRLPSSTNYLKSLSIWRGQIYHLIPVDSCIDQLLVVTVSKSVTDIWDGIWKPFNTLKLSSTKTSVSCGETRLNCASSELNYLENKTFNNYRKILGDDRFLIFRDDPGVKVWQFDYEGLDPSSL